ncbi:MAG TPA: glycosyltransferase family A protein [Smithella sp.]|nr:glycosyltransferase family A protein [Smithella sp.]
MESGFISVIIPVHNGERYLADALDSVMAQKCEKLEIIVVNDGSTDGTQQIARSYQDVMYISQSRQGAGAARNNGVKHSRGKFLAFLDADDLWMPDKTTKQMSALLADSGLDMVFGHVAQFYSPELEEVIKDKIKITQAVMPGYVPGAMLIKKEAFLKAGYFNPDLKVGEFIDWYLRAQDCGLQGGMLPEVVLKRRIHDANTGIRERDSRRDYLRVLKASLDRKRKKDGAKEIHEPAE